jgi:hypothetical protein
MEILLLPNLAAPRSTWHHLKTCKSRHRTKQEASCQRRTPKPWRHTVFTQKTKLEEKRRSRCLAAMA